MNSIITCGKMVRGRNGMRTIAGEKPEPRELYHEKIKLKKEDGSPHTRLSKSNLTRQLLYHRIHNWPPHHATKPYPGQGCSYILELPAN